MMYANGFVASLKVDGKFLRDKNGIVELPFNSEYSLYLKNMETRNAIVKVSIDDKDVLSGNSLVIKPSSYIDLEGFLVSNVCKNKFKFIELTKEIEEYRRYKPEDSLIRIEVRYEKTIYHTYPPSYWEWKPINYEVKTFTYGCVSNVQSVACSNNVQIYNADINNDVGITVKGSEINTQFFSVCLNELEENSHIIILKLKGYKSDNIKVEKLITTKDKIICVTCGNKNNYESNYCNKCGTFLEK